MIYKKIKERKSKQIFNECNAYYSLEMSHKLEKNICVHIFLRYQETKGTYMKHVGTVAL